MRKISVCSWCGVPFEIEDDEQETDVCQECIFIKDDDVGMIDDEDLVFLKGEK